MNHAGREPYTAGGNGIRGLHRTISTLLSAAKKPVVGLWREIRKITSARMLPCSVLVYTIFLQSPIALISR